MLHTLADSGEALLERRSQTNSPWATGSQQTNHIYQLWRHDYAQEALCSSGAMDFL